MRLTIRQWVWLIFLAIMGTLLMNSVAVRAKSPATDRPWIFLTEAQAVASQSKLNQMADLAVHLLIEESPEAQLWLMEAAGYAVFKVSEVGELINGMGGSGVAINLTTPERTYMRMSEESIGLRQGFDFYRLIVVFVDPRDFAQFRQGTWALPETHIGGTPANPYRHGSGLFVAQLTSRGTVAFADPAGIRFWPSYSLNRRDNR